VARLSDGMDETALHVAAGRPYTPRALLDGMLASDPSAIDVRDRNGWTPLHVRTALCTGECD
jgi:hypothetical protein